MVFKSRKNVNIKNTFGCLIAGSLILTSFSISAQIPFKDNFRKAEIISVGDWTHHSTQFFKNIAPTPSSTLSGGSNKHSVANSEISTTEASSNNSSSIGSNMTNIDHYHHHSELTTQKSESSTQYILINPGLDARQEIANYNIFMDKIFEKMNLEIKKERLDPIDLKLLPASKSKLPRIALYQNYRNIKKKGNTINKPASNNTRNIKAWLHGMSTLQRSGDVSIFIHQSHKTVKCPFALGPLVLKVSKTIKIGNKTNTKSATATTELMLGLMDVRINGGGSKAAIIQVIFDEPGGVDIKGNLRRGSVNKTKPVSPYKLVIASKTKEVLKKVAKSVVSSSSTAFSPADTSNSM